MTFFNKLQQNPKLFKRFTGLSRGQFNHLAGILGPLWECSEQKRLLGKERQRKIGGGMNYKLEGIREKLFAVLIYYRLYITQELVGFLVELDQSNVSRLITAITPLLLEAADPTLNAILEEKKEGPKSKTLEEFFINHPEIKELYGDGTESPVQRPKDKEERKNYYSGKKKRHTIKHQIICTSNRRILDVSAAYQGKVHDKKIFDSEKTIENIPLKVSTLFDLGYNGLQKEHPNRYIVIPPKKPRGRSLTSTEKLIRKLISSRRVVVENTIGAVKHFKIVKQIFRGEKKSYGKIFQAACALHNFKLSTLGGLF